MTDDNSSLILSQGCPSRPTLVSQQQGLVLPPKVMPIFLAWYAESFLFPTCLVPDEDEDQTGTMDLTTMMTMKSLVQVVTLGDDVDFMILLIHMSTNLNMSWDLIRQLLNKPITVRVPSSSTTQTTTTTSIFQHLLHIAANRTDDDDDSAGIITEHLLRYGANIESQDDKGFTPLATAVCLSMNESVAKVLLRGGADFDDFKWKSRNDSFPCMPMLHFASMNKGTAPVVKLLLEKGANIETELENGWTPLAMAVMFDNYPLVSLLLQGGADCQHWRYRVNGGLSMTQLAIGFAFEGPTLGEGVSILKLLLEQECGGNIVNGTNDRDRTPLHCAAILDDINGCKTEVIQLLLAKGANVHARDFMGYTVLHVVAMDQPNTVAVLKLLLDAGADIHAQDLYGRTVLHRAVMKIENFQAISLLLEHALKIDDETFADVRDSLGRTALHYVAIFRQRNANILPAHKSIIQKLLDMSQDVNIIDKTGCTPLHAAVLLGNEWYVRALLSCGAADALNVQDEHGRSPLHYAVRLNELDIAKLLLDEGAEINTQGELRRTALHLAAKLNQLNMAQLLMERGADPTITDLVGMNPLDVALASGAIQVAELLS